MSSEILWYANRATGAVCLVLFTVVVLLGIAVRLRTRLPGLPRFGTVNLHRTLSSPRPPSWPCTSRWR